MSPQQQALYKAKGGEMCSIADFEGWKYLLSKTEVFIKQVDDVIIHFSLVVNVTLLCVSFSSENFRFLN